MATQAERLAEYKRKQSPFGAVLEHIQYVKGDKGDPGDDGKTPTEQYLLGLIRPLIPAPIHGNDGISPTEKEILALIKPLIPKANPGVDGISPTKEQLLALIRPLIPKPIQPPTPQTIIDAVLLELKSGLLQPEHINGLGENIKSLQDLIKFLKAGGFRGGAGTLSASTGATPFAETVSGTIDGVNRTFTVPTTIVTAQALYLANSVYQPVVDFTTSGTTITMTVAPDISLAGQPFWLLHN